MVKIHVVRCVKEIEIPKRGPELAPIHRGGNILRQTFFKDLGKVPNYKNVYSFGPLKPIKCR
jgi:hypothetical protein